MTGTNPNGPPDPYDTRAVADTNRGTDPAANTNMDADAAAAAPPRQNAPHQPRRPRSRAVASLLYVGLASVLLVTVVERNVIRAWWWAYRLSSATELPNQAYYVGSLAAVGEDAAGPTRWLAGRDEAALRSMAVTIFARLPESSSVPALARVVEADPDLDNQESAALTLAFMDSPVAVAALDRLAGMPRPFAAAATAALGRSSGRAARARLCDLLLTHTLPLVRAQAAESLADSVISSHMPHAFGGSDLPGDARESTLPGDAAESDQPGASGTADASGSPRRGSADGAFAADGRDPFAALVRALSDEATFAGTLASERQIAAVTARFARTAAPADGPPDVGIKARRRSVGQAAAAALRRLCGQSALPGQRSPEEQAKLADHLRGLFLKRQDPSAAAPR